MSATGEDAAEPVVGDAVDVAALRTRMTDAVRRAGTGTARFDDADWSAEATFSVAQDGSIAVRLVGQPYAASVRRVVDGTRYEGWTDLPGVWDEQELEGPWLPGDPLRLVASLPDGTARVVGRSEGLTTYRVTADEWAIAAFCDATRALGDTGGAEGGIQTLWSLDDTDLPVRVGADDGRAYWFTEDIRFHGWGSGAPVTAPPPVPPPPSGAGSGPGERALHTLVVQLARSVAAREGAWTSALFITGRYPREPGSSTRAVQAQWWLLTPHEGDVTEAPVVDGDQWDPLPTDRLTMTDRFVTAMATAPLTARGREANLLAIRLVRRDEGVAARYGWTHSPDLTTPEGGLLLPDPVWVSTAVAAAEPTDG